MKYSSFKKRLGSCCYGTHRDGPYLPIDLNGKKKQVYLAIFVDDAARFILHGEFYPVLDHHCRRLFPQGDWEIWTSR